MVIGWSLFFLLLEPEWKVLAQFSEESVEVGVPVDLVLQVQGEVLADIQLADSSWQALRDQGFLVRSRENRWADSGNARMQWEQRVELIPLHSGEVALDPLVVQIEEQGLALSTPVLNLQVRPRPWRIEVELDHPAKLFAGQSFLEHVIVRSPDRVIDGWEWGLAVRHQTPLPVKPLEEPSFWPPSLQESSEDRTWEGTCQLAALVPGSHRWELPLTGTFLENGVRRRVTRLVQWQWEIHERPAAPLGHQDSGATGQFTLTWQVTVRGAPDHEDCHLLDLIIRGAGTVPDGALPDLAHQSQFLVHSSELDVAPGVWRQRFVISAGSSPGPLPVQWTYFDPDQGSYVTLEECVEFPTTTRPARGWRSILWFATGVAITGLLGYWLWKTRRQ